VIRKGDSSDQESTCRSHQCCLMHVQEASEFPKRRGAWGF